MKDKKMKKVLKKVFGSRVSVQKKVNVPVQSGPAPVGTQKQTDFALCRFRLVGTHTAKSKTPGIRSVFGAFPTKGGAQIYVRLLEKALNPDITFEIL